MNVRAVAALLVILNAVCWGAYFVVDTTPAGALVRLSWAAALVTAFAVVVGAVVYLVDRR